MSRAPRPDSFRLRPPPVALPGAARWTANRAFGPRSEPPREAIPPADQALAWATRLGLLERIAVRRGGAALTRELGGEAAGTFAAAARRAAAQNLLLRELASLAVATAAERGIQVLLLKGIALLEEIPDLDAARPLADVDLLVEPTAATELALALEARGFSRSPVHESAQHLPALYHPRLGTLEIHVHLPGVGRAGDYPAAAACLLAAARGRAAPELAPALVPTRPLLAAHALSHGLVQSAHSPAGYPLLRLAADLQDLSAGGPPVAELIDRAAPWLATSISRRELTAVERLCADLAAGGVPPRDNDARRFVDHVVAAHLDPDYRRALKARALSAALRRGDWFKIRRRTLGALTTRGGIHRTVSRAFRVGWTRLTRRHRRGGAANGF